MNFDFADDLMNWLNALDSSEMEAKDVRSAVYHWALERRPAPGIRDDIALQVRLAMQDEMQAKPEQRVRDRCSRANVAADAIIAILRRRPASVDTHPEGGDANAAPFMSGAVAAAKPTTDAQNPPQPPEDQS